MSKDINIIYIEDFDIAMCIQPLVSEQTSHLKYKGTFNEEWASVYKLDFKTEDQDAIKFLDDWMTREYRIHKIILISEDTSNKVFETNLVKITSNTFRIEWNHQDRNNDDIVDKVRLRMSRNDKLTNILN